MSKVIMILLIVCFSFSLYIVKQGLKVVGFLLLLPVKVMKVLFFHKYANIRWVLKGILLTVGIIEEKFLLYQSILSISDSF